MKGKVIVAIERAEQIISQIEHLIKVMPLDCLPDSFTFQVLKLEEYASLLKGVLIWEFVPIRYGMPWAV